MTAAADAWRSITPMLWLLYSQIAMYALMFMIQQPVQPFLIDKLSADDKLQFGFIRSFTGALQVVGSLISGVLIDRIGCKNVLLLSFLASALSYGITAGASDLLSLYVAQVPTLLQHAMLAATAYVAIESHDATTAAHIGFVRVAYGAGAVLGPAVGGQIGKVSLQLGAGIATAGSLVSVALVALFLKDAKANKVPADSAAANDSKPAAAPSKSVFDGFRHIVDSPLLLSLMGIKVLFSLAMAMFHAVFSLVAKDRFNLDPAGLGILMSYVSGLGLFAQYSERTLITACSVGLIVCFAIFAGISTVPELYALCVPLAIMLTLFSVVNTAQIARGAPSEMKGTMLSADMAIGSGSRMVTPVLGAYLLSRFGFWSVGASSAATMAVVTAIVLSTTVAFADAADSAKPHQS